MLRHAGPRSLLLLDEFGKGTLSADGSALLCATAAELAGRPVPPRTLVCTHFMEALDPTLLPHTPQMQFYTMCVRARWARSRTPASMRVT